jgi:hypothetical protein
VRHVVIEGAVRVRAGELLGVDLGSLTARARREAQACARRAGIS